MHRLFYYGFGYSAQAFARRLEGRGDFHVSGTTRGDPCADRNREPISTIYNITGRERDERVVSALRTATHLLVSASPDDDGDPMLRFYGDVLRSSDNLSWVGYLSTIGVYGDQNNSWVDEDTPVAPLSIRARCRVSSEQEWFDFGTITGRRVQVFRLAGIYGPGRCVLDKLRDGTARRIFKQDQVFNRIHVDDIANVLAAALAIKGAHRVYNVCDDEPAPPQDVVAFGAKLLRIKSPPLIPFEKAGLSMMGRSFYNERRRLRNERIKTDLKVKLLYPTYREGLRAIASQLGGV